MVRGLIEIGVRQGEHVGVLMAPRPSALAVVVALNRVGAVAVLLRPDGDTEREAELGQVQRIIADPERAWLAAGLGTVHTFVLGGGGGPRDLGVPLTTDMEQIDPDRVALPRWYRPNPGRASDLAFILFTGVGENVRMSRITNHRWATSAFGTASSAALSGHDTVYSVTPLYHPSRLMMSIGGAIAGGARLAMAAEFDPTTFWDEVRRYGVTVASYTWTLLHDLVQAPAQPGERHHPVRLFIGSGMPRGLWRRVQERFKPARVLEFYASAETGAILVNLRGAKPGAMGRPLPGSPEVRLAAYDLKADRLALCEDGFVRVCGRDEIGRRGRLLARGQPPRRDPYRERAQVHGADSRCAQRPAGGRSGRRLRMAAARGRARDRRGPVTLRPGHELAPEDLASLPSYARAAVVRVVDSLPVTTWYRPLTASLREAGLPQPGEGPAWYLDRGGRRYRRLTDAARRRLGGGAG